MRLCQFILVFVTFVTALEFAQCEMVADDIKWNFSEGDKFAVKISQKNSISAEVVKKKIDVELVGGSEMDWQIKSVLANGNALIEQTFTRMYITVSKTAKADIVYDTASEKPPEKNAKHFVEVYNKIVGIKFLVEMSDRGEIIDVSVGKKDVETIRSIPESMEARKLFEKEGLVDIFNSGGFMLPKKAIEKGFQWPVTKKKKMSFGTANFESVFTYNGTSQPDTAEFTIAATAELTDLPKNPAEKPMVLKSQSQNGEILFNIREGFLKSIQTNLKMETEKPFREMLIETSTSLETKMTIEKK